MSTATYVTKTSTRRVHLVVAGAHHGSFYSDGNGASGHVYTPADGYTLCGSLTKYGGYAVGEQTTDGAEATCKVCVKRFAALDDPVTNRFVIQAQGGFLSRIGGGTYEITSDVTKAIQFDNAMVAAAYVKYFDVIPYYLVVAA